MHQPFCPSCLLVGEVGEQAAFCPGCGFPQPAAGWPVDEFLGRVINGKYRLTEKLGEGGFGVVLRGRHLHGTVDLGDVVLKFLHQSIATNPVVRKRFVNEARAARALRTPHVVKVFDFDFDERGLPFIVMEYLAGRSLAAVLKDGTLSPVRVLRIGMQAAGALHECHCAGIIHRDLKPDNILLLPDRDHDFVKLLDFGIARLQDSTLSQTIVGTPQYMAPEQIRQGRMDAGVDIFALGVLLYECLTGQPPIDAATPLEYLVRNLEVPPRPLRDLARDLPQPLEGLLAAMMAKERAARPATMADVEARLKAIGVSQGWLLEYGSEMRQAASTSTLALSPDDARESRTQGSPSPGADASGAPVESLSSVSVSPLRRRWLWAVVLSVGAVAAAAMAIWLLKTNRDHTSPTAGDRFASPRAVHRPADAGNFAVVRSIGDARLPAQTEPTRAARLETAASRAATASKVHRAVTGRSIVRAKKNPSRPSRPSEGDDWVGGFDP